MKRQGYILGAVTGVALLLWFYNKKKKLKVNMPFNLFSSVSYDDFVKENQNSSNNATPSISKKHSISKPFAKVSTTQVTLTNHTDTTRTLQLWAGNTNAPITPITRQDRINRATGVENSFTIPLGGEPQDMVYNPFNKNVYVVNQLLNTLSVIDSEGTLVARVALGDFQSPVSIAVNTLVKSSNYGKVYVLNSIANTISIIGADFEVETSIAVGSRPIAVAFNPINEHLYIANIGDDTLSIIDTNSLELVNTLDVAQQPRSIAVDTQNRQIFVSTTANDRVLVFDFEGNRITFLRLSKQPTGLLIIADLNTIYVVSSGENRLIAYSTTTYSIINSVLVGTSSNTITYHPDFNVIYLTNTQDNSISVFDTNLNSIGTISTIEVGTGLVYNPTTGDIISGTTSGVQALRFVFDNPVSVNDGYFATVEEFQYNPAQIEHLKMIFSTQDIAGVLRIGDASVNGKREQQAIALNEFTHPMHRNNTIREITALNKTIIDGKTRWSFDIAPKQRITLLLYYTQWKRKEIINSILPTTL